MFAVETAAKGNKLETQLWRDELQLDGDDVAIRIRLTDSAGNVAESLNVNTGTNQVKVKIESQIVVPLQSGIENEVLTISLAPRGEEVLLSSLDFEERSTATSSDFREFSLYHGNEKIAEAPMKGSSLLFEELEHSLPEETILTLKTSLSDNAVSGNVLSLQLTGVDCGGAAVSIEAQGVNAYLMAPPTDFVVDGLFDEWQNPFEDVDEEPVDNENVDITNYDSARQSQAAFFYLRVDEVILAGVDVPSSRALQVPSEGGDGSDGGGSGDPGNDPQDEKPLPVNNGEDTVYIFLDTNGEVPFGYNINDRFYATHMVEVTGQHGTIISSKFYQYDGRESLDEWKWKYLQDIDSASAGAELEAGLELDQELLSELSIYFHVVAWDQEDEDHAGPIGGELLPITNTRTAPISGQTLSFYSTATAVGDVGSLHTYVLVAGDFDNDGDIDLVTGSNDDASYELYGWQSDGTPFDGGWTGHAVGATGRNVLALAAADFDGDGNLDLASGGNTDPEIYVWKHSGNPWGGTWTTSVGAGNAPGIVYDLAVGDFDKDGDPDLASITSTSVTNELYVWQNDDPFGGAWTGQAVGDLAVAGRSVAVGDFDNDGWLDIASGSASTTNEIYVWPNDESPWDGWGTGNAVGDVGSEDVFGLEVGDFNGDGDLDLASGCTSTTNEISVWQNNGDPFTEDDWTGQAVGDVGTNTYNLAVGDLDNDGDLDLASSASNGDIDVWQNDGSPFSGTWSGIEAGDAAAGTEGLAVGDLDNDGDLDLATSSYSTTNEVKVWKNTLIHRNAVFDSSGEVSIEDVYNNGTYVTTADMDGDGDLDVLSAGYTWGHIKWWENDGSPEGSDWTINSIDTGFSGARAVNAADIDGDGDMDVIGAAFTADDIAWWRNDNGLGTSWTDVTIDGSHDGPSSVHAADMDGDGDLDVVAPSENLDKVSWWVNDGTPEGGSWTERTIHSLDSPQYAYPADIDSDGDMDVVIGSSGTTDDVLWRENTNGLGTSWTTWTVDYSSNDVECVLAADIDGNGDMDILACAKGNDDISWWINDGDPKQTWWTEVLIDNYAGDPSSIQAVDMDMDGDLDVLGIAPYYSDVAWWENDGSPEGASWTQNDVDGSFSSVEAVHAADIDGDGDPDVVASSGGGYCEIAWWENLGGSAGYTVTDTAPAQMGDASADDDVMKLVVSHNGISGDNHLEINKWNFLLEKNTGSWGAMTTANAQGLFDNLHIYYDSDGDNDWSDEGAAELTIASASFSLSSGVQTFTFTDNDAEMEIADTASKTYFLVVDMDGSSESYASTNSIMEFRFTFNFDADSLNEDDIEDSSVSVADSSWTEVPALRFPSSQTSSSRSSQSLPSSLW